MTDSHYEKLVLRKNEQKRIRAGHLWIFSNEIDTQKTPLKNFTPGQVVRVEGSNGQYLGLAYVNPATLISARIISHAQPVPLDVLLGKALDRALALRESVMPDVFYRLVHAEADQLPGLIIDRYDDVFVIQFNTSGSQAWRQTVIEYLLQKFDVRAIVLRNDSSGRELEGLTKSVEQVYGDDISEIELRENNTRFMVDVKSGQKTGWFYDQRDNRALLQSLVAGKSVLDLFSYTGGWGIQCVTAGASRAHCVDQSKTVVAQIQRNAELNQVQQQVSWEQADVFEYLKAPAAEHERYDVVVLDPPALIKRRKDMKTGVAAYQQLNQQVLSWLKPGGLLVTASCSYHLDRESLRQVLVRVAARKQAGMRVIAQGHQAKDHPVYLPMSETEYLKAFYVQVER